MSIIFANQTNQNIAPQSGADSFIMILYLGLTLYFLYRAFSTFKAVKKAEGDIFKISKQSTKMISFLLPIIAILGIYNMYRGDIRNGFLMLILAIAIFLENMVKSVIASNGFVADAKFIEWNQLKKWSIDPVKGELVVLYKKNFDEKTGYLRFKAEQANLIQDLFKKYKLNK